MQHGLFQPRRTIRIDAAADGFAFGPYDAVVITEMPDNVAAAAIALAFSAGGALRNCQTTALMTNSEALDAMRKAGTCGYKSMTTKAAAAKQ